MKWYYKVVFENYANFDGRARRMEYWMFTLIQLVVFTLLTLTFSNVDDVMRIDITRYIILVYLAATLVPWLALNVRRLHDVGKNGTFFLINFIPIVGRIWYLITMVSDGDPSTNQFGINPKNPVYEELNDIGKETLE